MPDLPWYRKAACRGRPLEWWYPNGTKGTAKEHLEAGKQICNNECPVRLECLQYAFEANEAYGTWGGLAGHPEEERARERRNWMRRKQAAALREAG